MHHLKVVIADGDPMLRVLYADYLKGISGYIWPLRSIPGKPSTTFCVHK